MLYEVITGTTIYVMDIHVQIPEGGSVKQVEEGLSYNFV